MRPLDGGGREVEEEGGKRLSFGRRSQIDAYPRLTYSIQRAYRLAATATVGGGTSILD